MTKISAYTPITTLANGDLFDTSQDTGGSTYATKSIDWSDILIQLFGTATPDASAIMQLVSTTKGFIPPKMTTAQRTTLSASAISGVMVYDTDLNQWMGWNDTSWVILG